MRLNKFLSETGRCSRREADAWIAAGRVRIDGAVAGVGAVVPDGAQVTLDDEPLGRADKPKPVYIALHKPIGITCTTERAVEGNIVDFVDHPARVFPIGRLDKDSEGLILLTNDGDIVNHVLRVENHHEKQYVVTVDRTITAEFCARMAAGVRIDEGLTRPCKVTALGPKVFEIVLTQGLNRQIRKMCEVQGVGVVALKRVRFLHIDLGHLKVGAWRNLTGPEVDRLLAYKPAPVAPSAPRPQVAAPARSSPPSRPVAQAKPARGGASGRGIPFGSPGGVGGAPAPKPAGGRSGARPGRGGRSGR